MTDNDKHYQQIDSHGKSVKGLTLFARFFVIGSTICGGLAAGSILAALAIFFALAAMHCMMLLTAAYFSESVRKVGEDVVHEAVKELDML